jgi:hypothetical protein
MWIITNLTQIYLESVLCDWNKKCKSMELPRANETINHQLFAADNWATIAQHNDHAE